ncbi:MAG: hypothetical protein ACRCR9_06000 [Chitinophagaceae bacterium]
MKTKTETHYETVIGKNTFYFYNPEFQDIYEGYITSLNQILLVIKSEIESKGLTKEIFEKLLEEKENGLRALLALTGFANESLKRLISVVRVVENKELQKLLYTDNWNEKSDNVEIFRMERYKN